MSLSIRNILSTAVSNSLDSLSLKLQESAVKAVQAFGDSLPFTKVAAAETAKIKEAATSVREFMNESEMRNLDPLELSSQLGGRSPALKGSMANNAMTAANAEKNIAAARDPQVSAAAMNQAIAISQLTEHRVMLEELGSGNSVIFRIMPEIAESRTVKYDPVAPPQSPGAFQKYTGTDSVQWSINATLTCRTTTEASENLRIINQLRAWTMPYFGENTKRDHPSKMGAPPPVIRFSGFRKQMIGPVPVVLTSLNWQFLQDVDYIPAQEQDGDQLIPFPTVMKVAIQLVESFSTDQFNGFDLSQFRIGNSEEAWISRPGQGMNDRQGTGLQGGATPPEEAQKIAPNGARSLNNSTTPTSTSRTQLGGQNNYGAAVTDRTIRSAPVGGIVGSRG